MNFKKIIIYQNDVLFNILNEIKEKFNFDVIRANPNNLDDLKKDLSQDYLIISKSTIEQFQNFLILDEIPVKLEKLVEQINLKFLKEKFDFQSDISIGSYNLNLNSRKITKKNIIVALTEREINLILFLKKSTKAVKIHELQKEVWEYGSELETHTVETHIYRLRKKIKEKFNDENFIISSKRGYIIT